jgi:uncharacterized protein YjbI with pentapeptide repeats
MDGARLVRAMLERAEMPLANLNGANLEEANLEGASLKHAELVSANLTGARLSGANLARADLESAVLVGVVGRDADLSLANLRGARIDGAELTAARLEDCVLEGAFAYQANLEKASLRGAVLRHADFRQTRLSHADLRGARASGIRLDGAIVLGARVHGLDFGTEAPTDLPLDLCDFSRAGDDSEHGSLAELWAQLTGIPRRAMTKPDDPGAPRRVVGVGDMLKNAELVFGGSAEVSVDGTLRQCQIKLTDEATLVVGETGLLDGCRVSGGRIHVHGRFLAPTSMGLLAPTELVVFERGLVATQLEQHRGQTRFGFIHGCRLRLNIKTPTPQASEK